jgi:hypothetical protein
MVPPPYAALMGAPVVALQTPRLSVRQPPSCLYSVSTEICRTIGAVMMLLTLCATLLTPFLCAYMITLTRLCSTEPSGTEADRNVLIFGFGSFDWETLVNQHLSLCFCNGLVVNFSGNSGKYGIVSASCPMMIVSDINPDGLAAAPYPWRQNLVHYSMGALLTLFVALVHFWGMVHTMMFESQSRQQGRAHHRSRDVHAGHVIESHETRRILSDADLSTRLAKTVMSQTLFRKPLLLSARAWTWQLLSHQGVPLATACLGAAPAFN